MVKGFTSAERKAAVKKQLRDKKGRWIEMGAKVKFLFNGKETTGTVVGFKDSSVSVETIDPDTKKTSLIKVPANKVENLNAKASLDKNVKKPKSKSSSADKDVAPDVEKAPVVPTGTIGVDADGKKYVSAPDGQPIYVGTKVKSKTDGLEGTVKTLEGNGAYVKVVDADGKIKGRKISTLDVIDGDTASEAPKAHLKTPEPKKVVPPAAEKKPAPAVAKTPEPAKPAPSATAVDSDGNDILVGDTVESISVPDLGGKVTAIEEDSWAGIGTHLKVDTGDGKTKKLTPSLVKVVPQLAKDDKSAPSAGDDDDNKSFVDYTGEEITVGDYIIVSGGGAQENLEVTKIDSDTATVHYMGSDGFEGTAKFHDVTKTAAPGETSSIPDTDKDGTSKSKSKVTDIDGDTLEIGDKVITFSGAEYKVVDTHNQESIKIKGVYSGVINYASGGDLKKVETEKAELPNTETPEPAVLPITDIYNKPLKHGDKVAVVGDPVGPDYYVVGATEKNGVVAVFNPKTGDMTPMLMIDLEKMPASLFDEGDILKDLPPESSAKSAASVPSASAVPDANGNSLDVGDKAVWELNGQEYEILSTNPENGTVKAQSLSSGYKTTHLAKEMTKTGSMPSKSAAPKAAAPATPTGPFIEDKNGNPLFVGSTIEHPSKGYTGTVKSIESNGQYVKVAVNETGKTHGLKASALTGTGSAPTAPSKPGGKKPLPGAKKPAVYKAPPAATAGTKTEVSELNIPETHPDFAGGDADAFNKEGKTMPSIAKTETSELDTSGPLYGAPAPEAPESEEDTSPVLNDEWLQKVKDRYLTNPNKKKDSVEQTYAWPEIQKAIASGDLAALNSLKANKYIDQDIFDDAKKQIVTRILKNEPLVAQHAEDMKKYSVELKEWHAANGTTPGSTLDYPGKPADASAPFFGGEADWTKAHGSTPNLPTALEAINEDPTLAQHGLSVAVDSSGVEDLDMRMRVTKNPDGKKQIEITLQLTSANGDALEKELVAQDVKRQHGVSIQVMKRDSDGFYQYVPGKSAYNDKGGSAQTFTYADADSGADITFRRGSTKTSVYNNALHNTAIIKLDENATPEQVQSAIAKLGVTSTPASEGDIHVLAENKLLSVFGNHTDATKNKTGAARATALDQIEKKYGVKPEDLVFTADANGRMKMFLPDEVSDKLIKDLNIKGFKHNVSLQSADDWMSIFTGTNPGLNATNVRWNEGVQTNGMSSSTDMGTGGADYVFTKVVHADLTTAGSAGFSTHAMIHPKAAMRRTDIYGNAGDAFGKHFDGVDVYKLMAGDPYEIMFKDSVPMQDLWYIVVPTSTRAELLKKLKAAGIHDINGTPIDSFVLESGMPTPPVDSGNWSVDVADVVPGAPAAAAAP